MRNSLILEFRLVFVAILGVIVPFGLLLYLLPSQTEVYWAWVIANPRSAVLIAAGYLGAVVYYVVALRVNDWQQIRAGLGGLIIFSVVLLIATMVHWNRFRAYHITTLVWLMFYYAGPLIVPIAVRLQTSSQQAAKTNDDPLPPLWANWLIVRAVVYMIVTVLGLLLAESIVTRWPWAIDPLELRVFLGQIGIIGWGGMAVLLGYRQWHQHRLGLLLIAAIGAAQLIGLLIGRGQYDWSAPFGLILLLVFIEWLATPLIMFILHRQR